MKYEFWFVVGSQHLYGPEVIKQVEKNANTMAEALDGSAQIPFRILFKGVVTTPDEIKKVCIDANTDSNCAGMITWMHTFSPSKMWIGGLSILNKPYLHLNTQFNRDIPFDSIDMDFMNLNQSAHGDREHGFITARLRMKRKVISGHWQNDEFIKRIGDWTRSAAGAIASSTVNVMRLGDNMRYVAVTEGDKIQAEKVLGWSVNTYGIGEFASRVDLVTELQVQEKLNEYNEKYTLKTSDIAAVSYQAKLEIALNEMLEQTGANAYTDTFEDLHGLLQLPGIATQNLMAKGYGFGPEGDWKQAALQVIIKTMSTGLNKGFSFVEDYTYHLEPENEAVLGAHMLEISPLIAREKPEIKVHDLSIGGKNAPARLVFEGKEGDAVVVSIVDMGGRFRLIAHDVQAIVPIKKMPKLPVARVMWRLLPDMTTGNEAWILSGGAHHSILTYDLSAQHFADLAEILGIEFVHIGKHTTIESLKLTLAMGDVIWNR